MVRVKLSPIESVLPTGIVRLLMVKLLGNTGIAVEPASMVTSLLFKGTVLQPQFAAILQSVLDVLIQLLGVIVTVILFDVAGLPVAHVALLVKTTVTASLFTKVVVVNVEAV